MTSTHDIANETKDQARGLAEHARGAGQDVASNARSAASDVAGTVKEQASTVASTARDEVRGLAGQASNQMRTQAEEQTRRVAQNLRQMSEQLKTMASQSESGPARDLVHRAAHHGARAADFIESRGPSGIVDEVQRFARRRPGLFLLGAAAAGAAIGRLTRAAKDQAGSETSDRDDASSAATYASTQAIPSRAMGDTPYLPPDYPPPDYPPTHGVGSAAEPDTVTLPESAAPGAVYGAPTADRETFGGER